MLDGCSLMHKLLNKANLIFKKNKDLCTRLFLKCGLQEGMLDTAKSPAPVEEVGNMDSVKGNIYVC